MRSTGVDEDRLELFEWQRPGGGALVRVAIQSYQGHVGLDIREWYQSGGQWRPSKTGVRIPAREMGRFEEAVKAFAVICTEGKDPKVRRLPRREMGINATSKGTNPRALGTNPRALGTNPRAAKEASNEA